MLLFGFLLAFRVPNRIGMTNFLPSLLNETALNEFLESQDYSVIIYADYLYDLPFMDFAIQRYRDTLRFAFASDGLRPSTCQYRPCFVAYQGTTPLPMEQPSPSVTLFTSWCERVFNPFAYNITSIVELHEVFGNPAPLLLGVDYESRPDNIPPNVPFFIVKKSILDFFELGVDSGLYVYRRKDRQLLPFKGNFDEESKTVILGAGDDFQTKPFFCGYFKGNDTTASQEIAVLQDIARDFGDKFEVVIISQEEGSELIKNGRLKQFTEPGPYLYAFRSHHISGKRWVLQGSDALSRTAARAFIQRVVNEQEAAQTSG
jgi:hypothetical protein